MDFTEEQIRRYARHIILPEVGGLGQAKLLAAKVLVVGAGGLGSPLLLYLAAAGVGKIGVVDDDVVDLSNLQRQIVHDTNMLGVKKVESAKLRLQTLNPDVELQCYPYRLNSENIVEIIREYDVVADGSDNFPTRFLINDACWFADKTLVSAAILRFDGQLSTFKKPGPCYRCLYHDIPPDNDLPTCSSAGVFGAIAGAMGGMQALEVLKEILGIGEGMAGSLLIYDALDCNFRKVKLYKDPHCPLCGVSPSIKDLSHHDGKERPNCAG